MTWAGWTALAVIILLAVEAVIIIPDKLPVIRRRRNGNQRK